MSLLETNVDSYIEVEWEADGLLTRMSEMEKQIESVSTKTNAISYGYVASNILCIGDSLTAGAFYAGEANNLDISNGTAIARQEGTLRFGRRKRPPTQIEG